MPTLTTSKTITYSDAVTETPYTITAPVTLLVSVAYRDYHSLSVGTPTEIFSNYHAPTSTGDIKYMAIFNTGANSAYVAFLDIAGKYMMHEIPAGTCFDFFGQDIMSTDYIAGALSTIDKVYCRGNTTIEVDVFM